MKTFRKTIWRMLLKNKGRFIANVLIVMISLAITAGLAALPDVFAESFLLNYSLGNTPDIVLKNTTESGFQDDDLNMILEDKDVESARLSTAVDIRDQNVVYRLNFDTYPQEVNKLTILEGKIPDEQYQKDKPLEVMIEEHNANRHSYPIGMVLTLHNAIFRYFQKESIEVKVVGVVNNPMYNCTALETAMIKDENGKVDESVKVDVILYFNYALLPKEVTVFGFKQPIERFVPHTDMLIKYRSTPKYFTKEYENEMERKKEALLTSSLKDEIEVLTLEENLSYALFKNYTNKIEAISYIFPVFFLLVCALVNLITITRLIKDERNIIATYTSLGLSKGRIVMKYVLFSFASTLIGALAGILFGVPFIPFVIRPAYSAVFQLCDLKFSRIDWFGPFCGMLVIIIAVIITLFTILSYLRETPAVLMKGKAPKPGKKILLQRIPFIWNPLPFRFKSSLRNIFRQKKNLLLTSLSIIGSTVLVFLGFGLMDASKALRSDALFGSVAYSMGTISLMVVFFALAMAIVVVYSLANMNISDREREIATLKVLGYHEIECSFYTFREIFIVSILATCIGIPIAALITDVLLGYLEFGSLQDVLWYSYAATFIIITISTLIVNVLLHPKIRRIDMNDSLKILE